MDPQPSATRTGTRKSTRRDCEGLWDWNLVSDRIHFSPGWIALLGCQEHEIGGTPDDWFQRVHPDDHPQLLSDIAGARAERACEFELRYRLRHKDGTYRWMASRGLVVRNDLGEAIRLTGTQSDVTVETVTDPLTGLPNRLLLLDRLTQSINRTRRYSTFHFALVLVELGRPSGAAHKSQRAVDPLLNAAARRLETSLRLPDSIAAGRQNDLVARVEGDLFAILLDGLIDLDHAKMVADRILGEMMNPFRLNGREVRLSPAIGIALSPSGYVHADEALRDGQTALHRARVLGGSHCEVFDADVLKSERSALQLESELESAMQRGEFELVYQPIVSLASDQVVGFEALVRWRHAVLGPISPQDFIPIAERTGLIVPLGRWIVNEACQQLQAWHADVPGAKDLWVSVNLSGVQMREPDLVEYIADTLGRTNVPPRSLVLELTEGVAMDDPVAVTTLLMRLRAMGVRISLDDFGTGYSSLAYLRQFPIDGLKIDQSFIRGIANDKDTAAIVGGIVAMAGELGLSVVAEGVENDVQLGVLRSLACESAQGYLFARPLDAKAAEEFIKGGVPVVAELPRGVSAGETDARAGGWQRWYTATMPRLGKELAVAAVVLVVVMSAGVASRFYGVTRSAKPDTATPPGPPEPGAGNHLSDAPKEVSGALPSDGDTPGQPGGRGAATAPVTKTATTPVAPPVPTTTFAVVHLHRLSKCRGRLVVSRAGVAFTPTEKGDDALSLKYSEFVATADKKTLTIRTANRTYRFSVEPSSSKERPETIVANIGSTIARSRVAE